MGPLFDSSISCAHFLSMLFFSMTYATGLPLLMPMAFTTLTISFYIDKMLLLRFYEKPPHMNDGVMQIILKILPFAAIIRLCFGCWMYGSKELFDSKTSDAPYLDLYSNFLQVFILIIICLLCYRLFVIFFYYHGHSFVLMPFWLVRMENRIYNNSCCNLLKSKSSSS